MEKIFKGIGIGVLFCIGLVLSPSQVLAQYYGIRDPAPVPVSDIIAVDKIVQHPGTGEFVDNLSASYYRFDPGEEVVFAVWITNTSDNSLESVMVVDTYPPGIIPVSGFESHDAGSRTITYTIPALAPGEKHTQEIKMRVVSADALAGDITCETNQALATVGDEKAGDTSTYCIANPHNPDGGSSNGGSSGYSSGDTLGASDPGISGANGLVGGGSGSGSVDAGSPGLENVKMLPRAGNEIYYILSLVGGIFVCTAFVVGSPKQT